MSRAVAGREGEASKVRLANLLQMLYIVEDSFTQVRNRTDRQAATNRDLCVEGKIEYFSESGKSEHIVSPEKKGSLAAGGVGVTNQLLSRYDRSWTR